MNIPSTIIPADIELVGQDGNAFAVIGAVQRGLRDAGNSEDDIRSVVAEMSSGNYDHLLRVAMEVTA